MILAIESSCDDSSIAVLELKSRNVVFHKKISQEKEHAKYGGVVPELASRLHAELLPSILAQTQDRFSGLKAIAVTNEPGLSVTLLEGLMMAKALALSLRLPLIGVNHLVGHIYSLFIGKEAVFPLSVLLVSGGHTMMLECDGLEFKVVATTMDDSFGESFDKCAKLLGLGYPGGPVIEQKAKNGDAQAYGFTEPLKNKKLAFSYSGLKNAFRMEVEKSQNLDERTVANLCASFQKVAVAHLVRKVGVYFAGSAIKDFAIVGGASANNLLREQMETLCRKHGKTLHLAPLEYCSDNAVMIARAAVPKYEAGAFSDPLVLKESPSNQSLVFCGD